MSSRNSLQHTVSAVEPVGAALGDEWYNSTTNLLYKRMVVSGVPQWATITAGASSSTSSVVVPTNISEKVNRTITNQTSYTVTSALAAALTLPVTPGYMYIIHSIYVTNVDTAYATTTTVSGTIAYATPVSTVSFANKIPIPARGALELLRKPQLLNPSDVINIQSLAAGVGANSLLQVTITYERVPTEANYFGVGVSAATTAGDVYTVPVSSSAAVIDSIRVVNSSDLGDIAITLTWTDATNSVLGTLTSSFIVPANATVELCETAKRIPTGNKIRATATSSSAISVFVSGRTQ